MPVLWGLFAGTATGLGFLLSGVPNVELMSLVVCLSGVVLGPIPGGGVGLLAAGMYSLASPYGAPVPWILAGQMLGTATFGVLGGMAGPALVSRGAATSTAVLAAVMGLIGTTVFEVLTNLAIVLGFGAAWQVVAAGAAPFFLIHAGTNTMIFAAFLPLLARRLGALRAEPLRGRHLGSLLVLCLVAAVPAAVAAGIETDADADLGPADTGWDRPLWEPFPIGTVGRWDWYSSWIPVQDGGLGARVRLLGEAGTSPLPLFVRDGIPQGTGHALADDPWLVPLLGYRLDRSGWGMDGFGGTGGRIDLARTDPRPDRSVSSYMGTKGRHESYLRGVRLLSPDAPWRVGFEFEEALDREGYNYTDLPDREFDPTDDEDFRGHGAVRHSHLRLSRRLAERAEFSVEYDYGRVTKDGLPVLGAGILESWDDGIAVRMDGQWGRLGVTAAARLRNRDVAWGTRTSPVDTVLRLLETGREGIQVELALRPDSWHAPPPSAPGGGEAADTPDSTARGAGAADSLRAAAPDSVRSNAVPRAGAGRRAPGPLTRLVLNLDDWSVRDSGADSLWAGDWGGPRRLDGREGGLALHTGQRLGAVTVLGSAAGRWDESLGWAGEYGAEIIGPGPLARWRVFAASGGRAPRSDERGTAIRHFVADRELVLLPGTDLGREKSLRLGASASRGLLGLLLAVEGVRTRLRDGISWAADPEDPDLGRWANGLDLDATRITASVGRQGRFLGWGRAFCEGTWQDFDILKGNPSLLPPRRFLRLRLMWERHFFQEDGILQLALFSTRTGEMPDPWDVTGSFTIPARTVHDLLIGFRLVGAHISVAMRNLGSEKHVLTAGSYSSDRELDLRLSWTFHH